MMRSAPESKWQHSAASLLAPLSHSVSHPAEGVHSEPGGTGRGEPALSAGILAFRVYANTQGLSLAFSEADSEVRM